MDMLSVYTIRFFISVCPARATSTFENYLTPNMEQTFVMIKPDGVQRRLIGEIISRFENKGLYLATIKMIKADSKLLAVHYESLSDKPFYNGLVAHMSSGVVVPMVFVGKNAVDVARKMIGATNIAEALPGTIRGDFANETGRNIIHGADSVENAKREIKLWFGEEIEVECFDRSVIYE